MIADEQVNRIGLDGAVAAEQYERAAELRDRLKHLEVDSAEIHVTNPEKTGHVDEE